MTAPDLDPFPSDDTPLHLRDVLAGLFGVLLLAALFFLGLFV